MNNKYKSLKLPNISSMPMKNNSLHVNNIKNFYFLNSLKNFRIKKESFQTNLSSEKNNKNIKSKSIIILNTSKKKPIHPKPSKRKKKDLKIIPNFSFKALHEIMKKNKLKKSASYNNNITIDKEKMNFESNFKNLRNDSNIYTSNVNYIKNKKMLILDKYIYDNNKYKPDRLGFFDASDFTNINYKLKKAQKGNIYYNHNKYNRNNNNERKFQ